MEDPLPLSGPDSELGAWHPALRPESVPEKSEETEYGQSHSGLARVTDTPVEVEASGSAHPSSIRVSGKAGAQASVESETVAGEAREVNAHFVNHEEKDHEILQQMSPRDAEYLEDSNTRNSHIGNGIEQTRGNLEDTPGLQDVWNINELARDDLEPKEGLGDQTVTDSTLPRPATVRKSPSTENLWTEDEQMDPAWGFKEINTEEDGLGKFNLTASLPQGPSLVKHDSIPPVPPLPNSQVEDIMEQLDQNQNSLGESPSEEVNGENGGRLGWPEPLMQATTLDPIDNTFFNDVDDGLDMDFPRLDDEQARFEEGLPLMPADFDSSQPDLPQYDVAAGESMLMSGDHPGASHFVQDLENEAIEESSSFRPHALDRKSTNQVINSLQFSSPYDNDNLMIPNDPNPETNDLDLSDSAIVGSIATDSIAEQHAAHHEPTVNGVSRPSTGNEDNLEAMWKAALADDELLDELEPSVDPSSFFAEDGEGFLDTTDENATTHISAYEKPLPQQPISNTADSLNNYTQNVRGGNSANTNAKPGQQQYRDSRLTPSVSAPYGLQYTNGLHVAPALSRPGMPEKAQSFADKSKGGYTSPYDLPIDVSRPIKKRSNLSQAQHIASLRSTSGPLPPPRTSSMNSKVDAPYAQQYPGSQPPILSQHHQALPFHSPEVQAPREAVLGLKSKPSTGSFFEELPVTAKHRPPSSGGRYTPQLHQPSFPSQMLPPPPPGVQDPIVLSQSSRSPNPSLSYQLVPPERMSAYSNVPEQPPVSQVPPLKSRYSPAPPPQPGTAPSRNRYATPPANANRPTQVQNLPFQPRTSSPLAQNSTVLQQNQQAYDPHHGHAQSQQEFQKGDLSNRPTPFDVSSTGLYIQNPSDSRLVQDYNSPASNYVDLSPSQLQPNISSGPGTNLGIPRRRSTSNSSSASGTNVSVPSKRALTHHRVPDQTKASIANMNFEPPKRSQTHSPGVVRPKTDLPFKATDPFPRPASANDPSSPANPDPTFATSNKYLSGRSRGQSQVVNYIKPSDGRENDPLERWKGCPIFSFGSGGNIVTSFPKQVPRYGAGQALPMIKCGPGEVKVQTGKLLPFDDDVADFPGPLKVKGKKKEILEWLKKKILHLETYLPDTRNETIPDLRKCHEERVILWRTIQVFVEFDGVIEGNIAAETAVKIILSPELSMSSSDENTFYGPNPELAGISRSNGPQPARASNEVEVLENLRKMLLKAEREKAVWHAADKGLWAHAILIASTLPKTVSMQVVHEFVRKEIRSAGDNTESLSALFEIFGGNLEQSIDQLVPPSARAGLQMVSKAAGTGPTKNALDGLDRWRETLTLILSNRSQDDSIAVLALGRLLSDFGRVEAAHTCYILARSPNIFGGADDPQVSVALLGASHLQKPLDYGRDLDSILLTEIYEFAMSVLAPAAAASMTPHLQAYKLYHAMVLAEHGYFSEAQQYCDSITSAAKATTKLSPYYHSLLFTTLEEFVGRLRQAPREGSGSWITKPSMDKVSGSVWAKFNSFVAGDESDTASTGSGKVPESDLGAFANKAGDAFAVNGVPSADDLYGAYTGGVVPTVLPRTTATQSRYAPSGQYNKRSSFEQHDRSSLDSQRSSQNEGLTPPTMQRQQSNQSHTSFTKSHSNGPHNAYKPTSQPPSYTPFRGSYLPTPPAQHDNAFQAPAEDDTYSQSSYQPAPPSAYQPAPSTQPPQSYEPTISAYEPPSTDSYMAPSYEPTTEETPQSPVHDKPKKKSFMDDDDNGDDFTIRTDAATKDKARRDREAEDNFRKAAEADGKFSTFVYLIVSHELIPPSSSESSQRHQKGLA